MDAFILIKHKTTVIDMTGEDCWNTALWDIVLSISVTWAKQLWQSMFTHNLSQSWSVHYMLGVLIIYINGQHQQMRGREVNPTFFFT